MSRETRFSKICHDIKSLKIQGAEQVTRQALKAILIKHDEKSIKRLVSLRPTEPCLRNCISYVLKFPDIKQGVFHTLKIMDEARIRIKKIGAKLIQNNSIVFTHCHSSTVISILIEAKRQGKKFQVYNTETRPNLQGRKTALELLKAKIPVTMFIDSAASLALKEADIFLFGLDAITTRSVINKVGNKTMAEIAQRYDTPSYACSFSWKFDPKTILGNIEKLEIRKEKEVWQNKPKALKINNVVFDEIPFHLVTGIISELGVLEPTTFIYEIEKHYPKIFKI
jgi:ribose 1,5-bisphosphate isomerase